MHALAIEAARHAGKLQRRLQHAALARLAGGVVVLAVPEIRLKRAGLAAIFGGEDAAVADVLLLRELLLDDDAKRVAVLGVVVEVEVVGEDVDEEIDERSGLTARLDGGPERRIDLAADRFDLEARLFVVGDALQLTARLTLGADLVNLR